MDGAAAALTAFNQAYKEMNKLYHNYAKAKGLSDTAFWVLYSLWERGGPYPQRELCEDWYYPPQTVNSALKRLEKRGLIALVFAPGSHKSKELCFTPEGRELARQVIAPLMAAERDSFAGLPEAKRLALLSATQAYIALLEEKTTGALALSPACLEEAYNTSSSED